MILRPALYAAILAAALGSPGVLAQILDDDQLAVVKARLADGAQQPWELGTRAQALLESDAPVFSVLSSQPLPPPSSIPSNTTSAIAPVLAIAHDVVANRSASNGNITGPQPLVTDSSAADPASIGFAVLLANWTGQGQQDGLDYLGAAQDQLNFLYDKVPHTSDGAISHRTGYVQLWSDFVYMVPPFLAYYGVLSQNRTLLLEGYNQISLYRKYLRDPSAGNMWKHVLLGPYSNDEGHWSTGNGWAAAGMLRVLSTIQRSQYANSMKGQQIDLANWVQEIHNGIYPYLDSTDLFKNYPDENLSTNASSLNFYDSSSTALLASTVYRLSTLWGVHTHLPFAERSRKTLSAAANSTNTPSTTTSGSTTSAPSTSSSSDSSSSSGSSSASTTSTGDLERLIWMQMRQESTSDSSSSSSVNASSPVSSVADAGSGSASSTSSSASTTATAPAESATPTSISGTALAHFTNEGWLTPVVDPYSYGSEGTYSPEGQAFIVEMQAAWQDWVNAGSPGANGAISRRAAVGLGWVLGAVSVVVMVVF